MAPTGRNTKSNAPHVALLRGINVGGKNPLPMAGLVEIFEEAGCDEVRTYIQSGNVVFRAAPHVVARLPEKIASAIAARFDLRVPVVLREGGELRRVLDENPYISAGAGEEQLHVAFLAAVPAPARVAALDPNRSPGDAFTVRGRDVFLHLPNGVARTKLTNAWLDSKLATISTVRNWRTVKALIDLL